MIISTGTYLWKYDKEWGQEKLELIKEFPGEVGMINYHKGHKSK